MAKAFRDLVLTETEKLNDLCKKWSVINSSEDNLHEEIQGEIRSTVGQAQLLMAERFKQFTSLIDNNEFNQGTQPTTVEDLQGFWDLISIQIDAVSRKFKLLDNLKSSGWDETLISKPPKISIKKVRALVVKPTTNPLDRQTLEKTGSSQVQAARQRLAKAKALAARSRTQQSESGKENLKTFDAPSFFSISSPIKKAVLTISESPDGAKVTRSHNSLTPKREKTLLGILNFKAQQSTSPRKVMRELNMGGSFQQ